MKQRIARLGVLQTGKIFAIIYGVFSLVMVPFIFIGSVMGPDNGKNPGAWMLIFMLVLYPLMGFVGGIIMAAVYNLAAKWIGGIVITVENEEKE